MAQLPLTQPHVSFAAPESMPGGESSVWTLNWNGGSPPYTVSVSFDGGPAQDLPATAAAASPFAYEFELFNRSLTHELACSYTVTVSDSVGNQTSASGVYTTAPSVNYDPYFVDEAIMFDVVRPRDYILRAVDPDPGETLTAHCCLGSDEEWGMQYNAEPGSSSLKITAVDPVQVDPLGPAVQQVRLRFTVEDGRGGQGEIIFDYVLINEAALAAH